VDWAVAEGAAEYIKTYQNRERPDFADAIIAATAVAHDLILVTYNRSHYPMPEIRLYPVEEGS
jgi:predicted nucleic acid-binding protein